MGHRRAGHSGALKVSELEHQPGLFKKEIVKTRKGNMSLLKVKKKGGAQSLILMGGQGDLQGTRKAEIQEC